MLERLKLALRDERANPVKITKKLVSLRYFWANALISASNVKNDKYLSSIGYCFFLILRLNIDPVLAGRFSPHPAGSLYFVKHF